MTIFGIKTQKLPYKVVELGAKLILKMLLLTGDSPSHHKPMKVGIRHDVFFRENYQVSVYIKGVANIKSQTEVRSNVCSNSKEGKDEIWLIQGQVPSNLTGCEDNFAHLV